MTAALMAFAAFLAAGQLTSGLPLWLAALILAPVGVAGLALVVSQQGSTPSRHCAPRGVTFTITED